MTKSVKRRGSKRRVSKRRTNRKSQKNGGALIARVKAALDKRAAKKEAIATEKFLKKHKDTHAKKSMAQLEERQRKISGMPTKK